MSAPRPDVPREGVRRGSALARRPGQMLRQLRPIFRRPGYPSAYISLGEAAGIGVVGTPWGLKGFLRLFRGGRRRAASIAKLLEAYLAAERANGIETVQEHPRVYCLLGLSFADVEHLALVAEKLVERHFPMSVPEC